MPAVSRALADAFAILEAELDALVPGWERSTTLAERAAKISEGYTGPDVHSRSGVGPAAAPERTPPLDHKGRAAYLAYFAPRALSALAGCAFDVTFDSTPVYDLGAGTGAASLWARVHGASHLCMVDHDSGALAGAASLLRRAGAEAPRTIERSIDDALVAPGAIAISAFTLGETVLSQTLRSRDDEDAALDKWLDLITPSSRAIFVDAGDRDHGQVMQRFRKRAIERGMVVDGPCPHLEACPALARERDWCHRRAPRNLSPRLTQFAANVGRDVNALAFSSLNLVPQPTDAQRAAAKQRAQIRVLAPPLEEKGRVRLPVCGPEGVRFVQVKKRDRELYRSMLKQTPGTVWAKMVADDVRDQTLHLEGHHFDAWRAALPPVVDAE